MPGKTVVSKKADAGAGEAAWLPQHSGQWLAARCAGALAGVPPPTLQMAMAGMSRSVRAAACCHQGAATIASTSIRLAHT